LCGTIQAGEQEEIIIPTTGGIKIQFAKVNAGTFTMGSPANEIGRNSEEAPHEVTSQQ